MNKPQRKYNEEMVNVLGQGDKLHNLRGAKQSYPQFAEYFDAIPESELNRNGYVHESVLAEYMGYNRYRLFCLYQAKPEFMGSMSEEEWEQKCKELENEINKEK
ncbi:hypothetical protein CON36_33155 [Bacillus cereus]|uniref:Uncharacterized protein n=2 Tax=Bacillus cereus group TaxID=86661 RepID=A0A9X6ST60_BACCE|nr:MULTISPECIES: hypothetical protein [Bacillus cereus group]PDZ94569.1 hypothetical protein CON36_33155 [Bacillus cereus]PFJ25153.1 hypothetical protein COJ15_35830 [Bacillus thuringiensis]